MMFFIELAGTAQIKDEFMTQNDAVTFYDTLNSGFKSNEDSIVCLNRDGSYNDRFNLTDRCWEGNL